MGTKNNPKNRKIVEKKTYNGKTIVPILFVDRVMGTFMAGKYENTFQLVLGADNRPLQWDQLNKNS